LKTPPKRRAGTAPAQAASRKLKPRRRNVAAARLAPPMEADSSAAPRPGAGAGSGAFWLYGEHTVAAAIRNPRRKNRRLLVTEDAEKSLRAALNRPWRLLVRDLEAAVIPGVAALMLTKVDSPEHVQAIESIVDELEAERGLPLGKIKFIALVEDANGFFKIEHIAKSSRRLVGLSLGSEDFAADIGAVADPETLFYPKQRTLFAAKAAGIMPMGFVGSIADFRDQEAFRAIVRRSRRMGFMCASAVHPLQVTVLNQEFQPSPEEVERAEKMIAAYDEAYAQGLGAVQFEGAMIDVPVVNRARNTVNRAKALAARGR